MTVTSGLKCCELYRKSGPLGSLVRMLLESSAWRSTRCYLTWKASATPARRLLFRLVPSTPRTEGTGSQLWPTPVSGRPDQRMSESQEARHSRSLMQEVQVRAGLWPTPTARDCKGANSMEHLNREGKRNHTDQLANAVKLWPTPSASDCGRTAINPILTSNGTIRHRNKTGGQSYARLDQVAAMFPTPTGRCGKSESNSKTRQGSADLQTTVGGQLNPTWVEWLMGFPLGWTDLSASETPSCHSSFTPSSGQ